MAAAIRLHGLLPAPCRPRPTVASIVDRIVYTRRQLLALRHATGTKSSNVVDRRHLSAAGLLRCRGNRAGARTRDRLTRAPVYQHESAVHSGIPTDCGYGDGNHPRQLSAAAHHYEMTSLPGVLGITGESTDVDAPVQRIITTVVGRRTSQRKPLPVRQRVLVNVAHSYVPGTATPNTRVSAAPTMYVLNAAALSKPCAVDHLAADLKSCNASVAIITETHFKRKHTDSVIGIDGYTVFRRDRERRRGGGVAMYVHTTIQSTYWSSSAADNRDYELLWVRVGDSLFVAALYHPPRPVYTPADLLAHIEACVAEISHDHPSADILLAGDLNQLRDDDVIERTGLTQIVRQPTRGASLLDRIFISDPQLYPVVRVVTSVVKSDHKAVVAMPEGAAVCLSKTRQKRTFRPKTPLQNANFLRYLSEMDVGMRLDADQLARLPDPQAFYDEFYTFALSLLDEYYPECTVTVTSRDPSFVTADIKARLRRKNRLMRVGRVEEAGAQARQIGREITRNRKRQLEKVGIKPNTKELWKTVRQLTGRQHEPACDPGVTADSLNRYYASVSTDASYEQPPPKYTVAERPGWQYCVTDYKAFMLLDTLKPTATGLDKLPAWFLRLAAPVFCGPVADLINASLLTSAVPRQWKQARIQPIPKVPTPQKAADYRPISITPVLTRLTERIVAQRFIYPALSSPPSPLQFTDQFAFRPTGSTTAAIISLLNTVINLLTTETYVTVLSFDFSKAFDTVRHATLLQKFAMLDLPDHVYNWLTDFFSNHSHCTKFRDQTSSFLDITASIIQGSAIGPAAYVVTAGDMNAATAGNSLCKYADDTYLVIPASNEASRQAELDNIQAWAERNNLQLNSNKSCEVIFMNSRSSRRHAAEPAPLPGIMRRDSLKMLGVDIASDFSVSQHVQRLVTGSAQTLYALRVLRSRGLSNDALQHIYRATVIARLTYAASAWRRLAKTSDRQRIDSVIDRARRYGYCSTDLPSFDDLCDAADDELFNKCRDLSNHVLHTLLPPPSTASQHYNLRERTHSLQLPEHSTHLSDCNFITHMLYKNTY